jgi:hypothetical protein
LFQKAIPEPNSKALIFRPGIPSTKPSQKQMILEPSPGKVLLFERKPWLNANDPCPIADELPDDYGMGVVVAVVAVMPIWLRKCAGRKERKQDKY